MSTPKSTTPVVRSSRLDAQPMSMQQALVNMLEHNIVAMVAAVIEARVNGAEAGMQWIVNTLMGPGNLPDPDETDAQAYFDLHAPSIEACCFIPDRPSLVGLGQGDALTITGDVDQGVAVPAAPAKEVAADLVNLGGDETEQEFQAAGSALPHGADGSAPAPVARGHESSADCWCHPEANYVDPDTGATVWVHKDVQ